jgi:hypothetical protein
MTSLAPIVYAAFVGISAGVALFAGIVAIAILGPTRAGAVTLPSVAAYATLVVAGVAGGTDLGISIVVPPLALGVAVVVAWLQRGTLVGSDARRATTLIDVGTVLAAMLAGGSIGFILIPVFQAAVVVPIGAVIGLISGLLIRSRQAGRRNATP